MTIKIYGTGCPTCYLVEENAKKAVAELGLTDVKVEHIFDLEKMLEIGLMASPAIAFDDQIKAAGRIPTVQEIKSWLQDFKK